MDLPWNSEGSRKFITNVGLITSSGPYGDNIMAAGWTHHVSYKPGLIAVCIKKQAATYENIKSKNEFGVNIASVGQGSLASLAGSISGKEVNKIKALMELGYKFVKAKKIKALMVEGAALQAECRLLNEVVLGDHVMFIGEVIEANASEKEAMAYHKGRYGQVKFFEKISEEEKRKQMDVMQKHKL